MKSRLIRFGITLGAFVLPAALAALDSEQFRSFVADNKYWVVVGPVLISFGQQIAAYLIQRGGKANPVSESPTA